MSNKKSRSQPRVFRTREPQPNTRNPGDFSIFHTFDRSQFWSREVIFPTVNMVECDVGTKVRVPAREWGVAWAKEELGDKWDTTFYDGVVIQVDEGKTRSHVVRFDSWNMEESMELWRVKELAVVDTVVEHDSFDDLEPEQRLLFEEEDNDSDDNVPLAQIRSGKR